ncbi:MAG: hypothetical protein EAZ08_06300 [Cytophagales bacterium]|nr:MAG: hypothetical protein EAZ08_06300 [Cytophagales bacterium]
MAKNKKDVSSLLALLEEMTKDKDALIKYNMGQVPDEEVRNVQNETGIDLSNYNRSIDSYAINHVLGNHGNPKTEAKRGQIAVELSDFELISLITSSPDKIEYVGKNGSGRDLIKYIKKIGHNIHYVEEVRNGKKEVVLQTLFKQK